MSGLSHCALQVVRVVDTQRNTSSAFYVKIKLGGSIRRTFEIDEDGRPICHDTLTFPRMDTSTSFTITLEKSRKLLSDGLVGRADITVARLQEESSQREFRLDLQSSSQMRFGRRDRTATILLSYRVIDALSRARIDLEVAEKSVEGISNSGEKSESTIAVVGSVKEVVDTVVVIVDKVSEIHPVFEVSWKAASALYKLVSGQYEKDTQLVDMVGEMKNAHNFGRVAKDLRDDRNVVRPKLRELLEEMAKCTDFVQKYTKHGFAARMTRLRDWERIDRFTKRFIILRRELDSVIGATAAKVADEIKQQQKLDTQAISEARGAVVDMSLVQRLEVLEKQLNPIKSDASDVSKRPRCLEGTRREYLDPIMEFLSSDGIPNVLWLTGAAGSGKSTIAVTASDKCGERGWDAAYIFFERGKFEPYSVIRTIAYELSTLHPCFASYITKAINERKKITGNTLKRQFEELLLGPLNDARSAGMGRIVVILDALDECGSVDERRDLLRVLKGDFARLPSNVRVLVTSRPENDVMLEQTSARHIEYVSLKHDSEEGRADVGQYIRKEIFEAVKGKAPIELEWEDIYRLLTDAAGGLFIWASTAVMMVGKSIDPSGKLGALVDNIQTVGGYGIDSLYTTAIQECGIAWNEHESRELFTLIVGFVMESKEGMSAEVIAAFLGCDEGVVDRLLSHLRSVLFYERGRPVRFHHTSFADYLLSVERSGLQPWHIDEAGQRSAIAERCFKIMEDMLRFNICGIESSFVYNKDIADLQERIGKNVPPHLDYACRFWATHVCELPHSNSLKSLAKLKSFAETHLLYWFEVLSLTGNYNRVAVRGLYETGLWAAPIDLDLSSFLWAAYRLASVFSFPISQSAPQVYLSAISLWRGESRVADLYSRAHPCVPVQRFGLKPPAQCMKIIVAHKELVTSVAFSSDGKRIVSGSWDKTVCIWDADTGELVLGPLKGHTDRVNLVAFSRDGKRVVSGFLDGTIGIWNAVTGELVSLLGQERLGGVKLVAFSPDGTRVVSGSSYKIVCIWDVTTGKLVSGPFRGYIDGVISVGFSPDGTRFVTRSPDKTMRVWNVDSGVVVTFKGHRKTVTSAAFSPDGNRIASGSWDETIRVWNAVTGELVSGPFEGHTGSVTSVAFSSDGKLIVSGSRDTMVRIWDSNTGELVSGPFEGHSHWVSSVAVSPDGKRAVSSSKDGTVRIWDVDSGALTSSPLKRQKSPVSAIGFSANGKRAVFGFEDGRILVWDIVSGELVSDAFEGHSRGVSSVALSEDGTLVLSGSCDKMVCVWNASNGGLVLGPLEGHSERVCSVAFSQDGSRIVSGSWDRSIRIWSAASGELVSGPFEARTNQVRSAAFSPDGGLVSGSYGKTIRVWNAVSGAPVSYLFQGHENEFASVAFSLNGDRIISGSEDGTISIWNASTGEVVLGPLEGHTSRVKSVAFSADGKRIVSGSGDRTVRVWDAFSCKLIFTFCGHGDNVLSVIFSPDGDYVYSGSEDGTIRAWYVGDGEVNEHVLKHSDNSSSVVPGTGFSATRAADVQSSEPKKRRAIADWKMTEDGWVATEKGELLTWLPEDMRASLWQARNTVFFGWHFLTRLDFSNAPVGEGWYEGFPRLERKCLGRAENRVG